ncbi:MAG: toll/interleukin-1 receptor domain-containing protein [Bacteroidota bacterium]
MVYEKIARKLQASNSQCVILLGPELAVNSKGQNHRAYFKELAERSDEISMYFESENLFAFAPEADEYGVLEEVTEYYEDSCDPILLEMVSRIPVPLIINVSPDVSINKIIESKYGDIFKAGHFTVDTESELEKLPRPTVEKPVIYNLFGTVDANQTIILQHSELYATMEKLLHKNSLPKNIEYYLTHASCYVFLGFKYDSWQYQLTCHKLKIKNSKNVVLSTPNYQENNSVGFIMKNHFTVDFTEDNATQVVQNIINACEVGKPGFLRNPAENSNCSVYISYSWETEEEAKQPLEPNGETIVRWLENELKNGKHSLGLPQIFRDKEYVKVGDSIDSFMTRIGKGRTVIRVVSDKYLRSRYCMDEALRMKEYKDANRRIFTVVLSDVILEDGRGHVYQDYWKEKYESIFQDIDRDTPDPKANHERKKQQEIYLRIYEYIDEFITQLKDQVFMYLDPREDLSVEEDQTIHFTKEEVEKRAKKLVDDIVAKMRI